MILSETAPTSINCGYIIHVTYVTISRDQTIATQKCSRYILEKFTKFGRYPECFLTLEVSVHLTSTMVNTIRAGLSIYLLPPEWGQRGPRRN